MKTTAATGINMEEDKDMMMQKLLNMKKELAKKQKKLEKAKRAAKAKAHVRQKLQEQERVKRESSLESHEPNIFMCNAIDSPCVSEDEGKWNETHLLSAPSLLLKGKQNEKHVPLVTKAMARVEKTEIGDVKIFCHFTTHSALSTSPQTPIAEINHATQPMQSLPDKNSGDECDKSGADFNLETCKISKTIDGALSPAIACSKKFLSTTKRSKLEKEANNGPILVPDRTKVLPDYVQTIRQSPKCSSVLMDEKAVKLCVTGNDVVQKSQVIDSIANVSKIKSTVTSSSSITSPKSQLRNSDCSKISNDSSTLASYARFGNNEELKGVTYLQRDGQQSVSDKRMAWLDIDDFKCENLDNNKVKTRNTDGWISVAKRKSGRKLAKRPTSSDQKHSSKFRSSEQISASPLKKPMQDRRKRNREPNDGVQRIHNQRNLGRSSDRLVNNSKSEAAELDAPQIGYASPQRNLDSNLIDRCAKTFEGVSNNMSSLQYVQTTFPSSPSKTLNGAEKSIRVGEAHSVQKCSYSVISNGECLTKDISLKGEYLTTADSLKKECLNKDDSCTRAFKHDINDNADHVSQEWKPMHPVSYDAQNADKNPMNSKLTVTQDTLSLTPSFEDQFSLTQRQAAKQVALPSKELVVSDSEFLDILGINTASQSTGSFENCLKSKQLPQSSGKQEIKETCSEDVTITQPLLDTDVAYRTSPSASQSPETERHRGEMDTQAPQSSQGMFSEFSEYTELDTIPFSQFEFSEDFLWSRSQSHLSEFSRNGQTLNAGPIVKRRSRRISVMKPNMCKNPSDQRIISRGQRLSQLQQKKVAAVLSIFQFLIDKAKDSNTVCEFNLPSEFDTMKQVRSAMNPLTITNKELSSPCQAPFPDPSKSVGTQAQIVCPVSEHAGNEFKQEQDIDCPYFWDDMFEVEESLLEVNEENCERKVEPDRQLKKESPPTATKYEKECIISDPCNKFPETSEYDMNVSDLHAAELILEDDYAFEAELQKSHDTTWQREEPFHPCKLKVQNSFSVPTNDIYQLTKSGSKHLSQSQLVSAEGDLTNCKNSQTTPQTKSSAVMASSQSVSKGNDHKDYLAPDSSTQSLKRSTNTTLSECDNPVDYTKPTKTTRSSIFYKDIEKSIPENLESCTEHMRAISIPKNIQNKIEGLPFEKHQSFLVNKLPRKLESPCNNLTDDTSPLRKAHSLLSPVTPVIKSLKSNPSSARFFSRKSISFTSTPKSTKKQNVIHKEASCDETDSPTCSRITSPSLTDLKVESCGMSVCNKNLSILFSPDPAKDEVQSKVVSDASCSVTSPLTVRDISKNNSSIAYYDDSYLSPGQMPAAKASTSLSKLECDVTSLSEKPIELVSELSMQLLSPLLLPWKKLPRTATRPVQVLEAETSAVEHGSFSFTPNRSKGRLRSIRKSDGKTNLKFTGCFQSDSHNAVVCLLCGSIVKEPDEKDAMPQEYIISVHATSLTVWGQDPELGWITELDWRFSPETHILRACLVPGCSRMAVLITGWTGSDMFASICIYEWFKEETLRYNFSLENSLCDTSSLLLVEPCPAAEDLIYLGLSTDDHHAVLKAFLSPNQKRLESIQTFEQQRGRMLSMVTIKNGKSAVLVLSADQRLTIWNGTLGCVLKTLDILAPLPYLSGLLSARTLQGYILLETLWRMEDGHCGGLLAMNPLNGKLKVIHSYQVPNNSWRRVASCKEDGGLITAVSDSGALCLWNCKTGKIIGCTRSKITTCAAVQKATGSKLSLVVGEIHGCLHIYSATFSSSATLSQI